MIRRPLRPERFVKQAGKAAAGNGNGKKAVAAGVELLLLRGDGSNGGAVVDSSSFARTVSGSGVLSTAQSKYGGSSIAYTPITRNNTVPASSDFALGSADWTIRAWVYVTAYTANGTNFFHISRSTYNNADQAVLLGLSPSGTAHGIAYNSVGVGAVSVSPIGLNAWVHLAFVRDGNTLRLYVNGVQAQAVAFATAVNSITDAAPRLGSRWDGDNAVNGYMDDFQFIKGLCLYPSGTTFTPPGAL